MQSKYKRAMRYKYNAGWFSCTLPKFLIYLGKMKFSQRSRIHVPLHRNRPLRKYHFYTDICNHIYKLMKTDYSCSYFATTSVTVAWLFSINFVQGPIDLLKNITTPEASFDGFKILIGLVYSFISCL